MMHRLQDWRSHLVKYAAEIEGKPFEWGSTDCGSVARRALIEMFGPAMAMEIPIWTSVREALLILEQLGSLEEYLLELGAEKASPAFVRAGDILISNEPEEEVGRQAIMVCIDGSSCIASSKEGVFRCQVPQNAKVYSLWEVTDG